MAVNFVQQVYGHTYDTFSRPCTITPLKSQPLAAPYTVRGIYNSVAIDVPTEENIISDQRTILDIIETEVAVIPLQGDHVFIGATGSIPAAGTFEVTDVDSNGGGESTLTLRRIVSKAP